MEHVRSHRPTYLFAIAVLAAISVIVFAVVAPLLGIAFHLISLLKIAAILLVAGAIFRSLLHAVDGVDHAHDNSSASGR